MPLVPALIILSGVFLFHQQSKRPEAEAALDRARDQGRNGVRLSIETAVA